MQQANDPFVSRAWLAGIPFTLWALFASLIGNQNVPLHPGFLAYLALAAFLMCFYGWVVSRTWPSETLLTPRMRLISLLQLGVATVVAGILFAAGHEGTAVFTAVVGVLLGVVCWPSRWALRRRGKELNRPYRSDYVVLSLVAAALAGAVAIFSVVDLLILGPSPTALSELPSMALMIAIGTSALIQAWDERRRPREPRVPVSPRSDLPR